jgi:hypothetical protein
MIAELIVGFLAYPVLKGYLTMRAAGWDTSNVLNFLRKEAFDYKHPEAYPHMYYLRQEQVEKLVDFGWTNLEEQRPFNYTNKDEFSDNFPASRNY